MYKRKLASVQEIDQILPIEGADNIVLATMKGNTWKCITKKGEFKPGDLGVYFEIDSIVEGVKGLEFMEARHWKVKSMRMRGVLSQGLLMPLKILPTHDNSGQENFWEVDDNVTDILGVTKKTRAQRQKGEHSMPAEIKDDFPLDKANKTDEERVQNLKHFIKKYAGTEVQGREKYHGSSLTLIMSRNEDGSPGNLRVCSRNFELEHPDVVASKKTERTYDKLQEYTGFADFSKLGILEHYKKDIPVFWKPVLDRELEKKFQEYLINHPEQQEIVTQQEVLGSNVQADYYKINHMTLRGFDVFDPVTRKYVDADKLNAVLLELGITPAKVVFRGPLSDNVDELMSMADQLFSELNPKVKAEGIVFRPLQETQVDERKLPGNRFSFKVVSNVWDELNNKRKKPKVTQEAIDTEDEE